MAHPFSSHPDGEAEPSPYGNCAICGNGAMRVQWTDEEDSRVYHGYLCKYCVKVVRRTAPHRQVELGKEFPDLRYPRIAQRLGWDRRSR